MALRPQPERAADRRDEIMDLAEGRVDRASDRTVQAFLRRVRSAVAEALTADALTAATSPGAVPGPSGVPARLALTELFTAAQAAAWWDAAVDENLANSLRDTWNAGWSDTSTLRTSTEDVAPYLAQVKDRLSPTARPALPGTPGEAFNVARKALSEELARGSSVKELSRRLAAEFGWDEHQGFWEQRRNQLNGEIDAILDPLGPPGSPARELARLNDPVVRQLQAQRTEAVLHIDRVQSTWQVRAQTIARTETVGAFNAGALAAYAKEGVSCMRWVSSRDSRTRHSHREANGQVVRLGSQFTLTDDRGRTSHVFMPGDPSGPAREVINCRCTTVGSDCPSG